MSQRTFTDYRSLAIYKVQEHTTPSSQLSAIHQLNQTCTTGTLACPTHAPVS